MTKPHNKAQIAQFKCMPLWTNPADKDDQRKAIHHCSGSALSGSTYGFQHVGSSMTVSNWPAQHIRHVGSAVFPSDHKCQQQLSSAVLQALWSPSAPAMNLQGRMYREWLGLRCTGEAACAAGPDTLLPACQKLVHVQIEPRRLGSAIGLSEGWCGKQARHG
jgi:hypothetical protein